MEKTDWPWPAPARTDDPAELARGRARVALDLKKYSLAERIARECIAQAPDRAAGYWLLARALRAQGRRREALEPAHRARFLDPGEPAYSQLIGLLMLELRHLPAASEIADALVEWQPDWPPSWDLQARTRLGSQDLAGAERAARTLLSLTPESADALCLLGRVLWQRGHHEEARDCFTAGLRLDPQHPGCLAGMVSWLLRNRQFREARSVARDLVRIAPDDPATARLYAQTVGFSHPLFQLWANWAFALASLPRWQRVVLGMLCTVPYLGAAVFLLGVLAWLVVTAWRRLRDLAPGWKRVALGFGAVGFGVVLLPVLAPATIVIYPVALVYLWLARPVFSLALKRGWFL
jgi:tetratricopeptide (TPR) repeat protein